MSEATDRLIDAAEAHADSYKDDDRECIVTDVMNAFYAGAKFAEDQSIAEICRLRGLMRAVVEQLDHKNKGNVDAPGHRHTSPGIWDSDNGEIAGKPCAWCALWKEAKGSVADSAISSEQHPAG